MTFAGSIPAFQANAHGVIRNVPRYDYEVLPSRDTYWCYDWFLGRIVPIIQPNGSSQPEVGESLDLIRKVVSDGSGITAEVDLRNIAPITSSSLVAHCVGWTQLATAITPTDATSNGFNLLGYSGSTGDALSIDSSWQYGLVSAAPLKFTELVLNDNYSSAFKIREGSNAYQEIVTSNGGEAIRWGNTTTNPSYTWQGSGAASFGGALSVTGALSALAALTVALTLGVTGATTLSSTLGVTGATTLSSTLHAVGATTLDSTLSVGGAATFSSTVAAADMLVTDNLASAFTLREGANNYVKLITSNGAEAIQLGSVALNQSLTLLGTGLTTLGGGLTVAGATTLSSTLHAVGAATLDSTLAVTGISTFVDYARAQKWIRFDDQGSDPSTVATAVLTYSKSGDLYVRDGAGNVIRMTASGAVNAGAGGSTWSLADNTSAVLRAYEGSNDYLVVSTINAAEAISLGNATTNPTLTQLGSGLVTLNGGLRAKQYVRLDVQDSAPGAVASTGVDYTATVGGIAERHYQDSAGNITQITSAGALATGLSAATSRAFVEGSGYDGVQASFAGGTTSIYDLGGGSAISASGITYAGTQYPVLAVRCTGTLTINYNIDYSGAGGPGSAGGAGGSGGAGNGPVGSAASNVFSSSSFGAAGTSPSAATGAGTTAINTIGGNGNNGATLSTGTMQGAPGGAGGSGGGAGASFTGGNGGSGSPGSNSSLGDTNPHKHAFMFAPDVMYAQHLSGGSISYPIGAGGGGGGGGGAGGAAGAGKNGATGATGGAGGGGIWLSGRALTGTGTIKANGVGGTTPAAGATCTTPNGGGCGGGGGSGGGGGGFVVAKSNSIGGGLTLQANGGAGANGSAGGSGAGTGKAAGNGGNGTAGRAGETVSITL